MKLHQRWLQRAGRPISAFTIPSLCFASTHLVPSAFCACPKGLCSVTCPGASRETMEPQRLCLCAQITAGPRVLVWRCWAEWWNLWVFLVRALCYGETGKCVSVLQQRSFWCESSLESRNRRVCALCASVVPYESELHRTPHLCVVSH